MHRRGLEPTALVPIERILLGYNALLLRGILRVGPQGDFVNFADAWLDLREVRMVVVRYARVRVADDRFRSGPTV